MRKKYLSFMTVALLFLLFAHEETRASSQKMNLTISNGVTYYGEVKNNKPHGKGTMRWGPYKVYSGDWYNGQRSGFGKYISDRVSDHTIIVYEGEWKNDRLNGSGIRKESNPELEFYSISKGLFQDDVFTSGHSIVQSIGEIWFEYQNGNTYLEFSVMDNEDAAVMHSELADGTIEILKYYKRIKSTPDFRGFEYARSVEDFGSSSSEGIYRPGDYDLMEIYTGVHQYYAGGKYYRAENYKSGKLLSAKDILDKGQFDASLQKKIKHHKHVLLPYLSEFSTLLEEIENVPESTGCRNTSTSICVSFPIKFE
ncbi:hypothetical protein [Paenibacillus glucanolyticus]|uniref:hypothetical protein n=1 Tax=Paenibacillus glucanolyticus TaxID=59843 RepID=UPI00096FB61E|nr:hypothetical protein [Paenibacillus glucanolyticus]OMF71440.1 hypothetical protein BK142_21730 [Paenibacillus glucanolyticus]